MWPIGIASALYSLLSVLLLLIIRKSIKEWGLNLHIKSDVIFFYSSLFGRLNADSF